MAAVSRGPDDRGSALVRHWPTMQSSGLDAAQPDRRRRNVLRRNPSDTATDKKRRDLRPLRRRRTTARITVLAAEPGPAADTPALAVPARRSAARPRAPRAQSYHLTHTNRTRRTSPDLRGRGTGSAQRRQAAREHDRTRGCRGYTGRSASATAGSEPAARPTTATATEPTRLPPTTGDTDPTSPHPPTGTQIHRSPPTTTDTDPPRPTHDQEHGPTRLPTTTGDTDPVGPPSHDRGHQTHPAPPTTKIPPSSQRAALPPGSGGPTVRRSGQSAAGTASTAPRPRRRTSSAVAVERFSV